jgi:TonB family protein
MEEATGCAGVIAESSGTERPCRVSWKTVVATIKMPAYTGNTAASLERRLHARQRLSAIVYLDIGAGNGGIVLNLSDEGLGFQAVGPLGKQKELRLRIKLPSTPSRVEVASEIVWVSDSNRQAGVRFVDAHSDGTIQIQEWIRSLISPPPQESPKQDGAAAEVVAKQEIIQTPEIEKEAIQNSEIELLEPSRQKPQEIVGGGTRDGVLSPQKDEPSPQKPESAIQPVIGPSEPLFLVRPAVQTETVQSTDIPIPIAPVRAEPENSEAIIIARSREVAKRESAQGWPAPVARTSAMTIPVSPDAPHKPLPLYGSAVEPPSEPGPAPVNPIFAVPAATSAKPVWSQMALAGFFAVCAVVCFGIGTWVGLIVRHRHPSEIVAAPVNVAQAAKPNVNASAAGNTGRLAPVPSEKLRKGAAANHSSLLSPKVSPAATTAAVLPTERSAPASNASPNVAPATITKEQESNPPAAAAVENSAAPEKNVAPLAIAKGKESESPAATAAENSAAAGTGTRIVGGLVLKPSDRFNPCHLAYRVEAVYPAEALQQRIEGVVKIQQVVGTDGIVRSVKLLGGPPMLAAAALEAARYWRYLPALLNGQPVETEQTIEIQFLLPE